MGGLRISENAWDFFVDGGVQRGNSAIHRLAFGQKQFRLLLVRYPKHKPPHHFPSSFSSSPHFSRCFFSLGLTHHDHHNETECSRGQELFDLTIIFTNNTSSPQAICQHHRELVQTDRPKAVSIKRRRDDHVHDILKNQNDIAQKLPTLV